MITCSLAPSAAGSNQTVRAMSQPAKDAAQDGQAKITAQRMRGYLSKRMLNWRREDGGVRNDKGEEKRPDYVEGKNDRPEPGHANEGAPVGMGKQGQNDRKLCSR